MIVRKIYHSFSRARSGETEEGNLKRSLEILREIKRMGLVLSPEIVNWEQPLSDKSLRKTTILQTRLCFTELGQDEINVHSKKFGPISLEFNIDAIRRLGALPVIYVPQTLKEGPLSALGASVVTQIGDIGYTISKLHELRQLTDPKWVIKNIPGARSIAEDCNFNLQNIDENGIVVQQSQIPLKSISDIMNYIQFKNAPFELMLGVLTLIQNMFYHTDDERHDESLAYYRQHEWRIVPGPGYGGMPLVTELNDEEKERLLTIDPQFWGKEFEINGKRFKRIEVACVVKQIDNMHISELIDKIYVPKSVAQEAEKIYSGKITILADE